MKFFKQSSRYSLSLFRIAVSVETAFYSLSSLTAVNADSFGELKSDVSRSVNSIFHGLFPVITLTAAISLILAFVMRASEDSAKSERGKQWVVRILVAYMCINLTGLIFRAVFSIAAW